MEQTVGSVVSSVYAREFHSCEKNFYCRQKSIAIDVTWCTAICQHWGKTREHTCIALFFEIITALSAQNQLLKTLLQKVKSYTKYCRNEKTLQPDTHGRSKKPKENIQIQNIAEIASTLGKNIYAKSDLSTITGSCPGNNIELPSKRTLMTGICISNRSNNDQRWNTS